ncbi:MAG: carboxypeptidase-like regulatory domain-containing protein [Vicinamibacterales bacterium]
MTRAVQVVLLIVTLFQQGGGDSGTLYGRVTDEMGQSIPGADVALLSPDGGYRRTVKTDDNGNFVVVRIPIGKIAVAASLPGFMTESVTAVVFRGRNLLDLGLVVGREFIPPPYRIRGRVGSTGGQSLAEVTVTLRNAYVQSSLIQVRSDAGGAFSITTYKPGDYVLAATLPGYAPAVLGVDLDATRELVRDVTLKPR